MTSNDPTPRLKALAGEIRASTTATLTAGTRTLDTNAIGIVASSTTATAGQVILPPINLLLDLAGYPIVLADAEGRVVRATVPATGTWSFALDMDWEESASDF